MLIAFVFVTQELTQSRATSCRGAQSCKELLWALSKVKYTPIMQCAPKAGHQSLVFRCISFADSTELSSSTITSGRWRKATAHRDKQGAGWECTISSESSPTPFIMWPCNKKMGTAQAKSNVHVTMFILQTAGTRLPTHQEALFGMLGTQRNSKHQNSSSLLVFQAKQQREPTSLSSENQSKT